MPIEVPPIDTRTWEELKNELLARIPSHTPEWTNQNASDPGVTLLELFAFLGESILYRANRIPERNRLAFLKLLGVPLQPGAPARALVTFQDPLAVRKPVSTWQANVTTLATGLELRSGKLAWHLDGGLDVLPVEAFVCGKVTVEPTDDQVAAYQRLYASLLQSPTQDIALYQTTPLGTDGLRFGDKQATVDGCVWIALLAPAKGHPKALPDANDRLQAIRNAIAGRVLSIGLAPAPRFLGRDLPVPGSLDPAALPGVKVEVCVGTGATPTFVPLGTTRGVLEDTSVLQLVLPGASDLAAWTPPELLDQGVGDAPPAFENASDDARLLVWLRLSPVGEPNVLLRWVGVNAALATQGDRVYAEAAGVGDGTPDQSYALASRPVVPGSLRLWVDGVEWTIVDDVGVAPREGAPGSTAASVDWEAGVLRFGTGLAGTRPTRGAAIRVSYEVNAGSAGNVGVDAVNSINGATSLKVGNPIPTWGGTPPETLADGERQVARWVQHRDRLVTAEDFKRLAARTPGADIARIEVLPAFHPLGGVSSPGSAPGCVTLMIVPPVRVTGEPPRPSDEALDAVCAWLEPRRLVTTELFLRGPTYVPVVVSVGIEVAPRVARTSAAEVREAVRRALVDALSPVPGRLGEGWPLFRTVSAAELLVVVASVPGVQVINGVLLGDAAGLPATEVKLSGLELPWLAAVSVAEGLPLPVSELASATAVTPTGETALPLPVVSGECG